MKAIIVDDELNARLSLRGSLEENFKEINIVTECKDVPSAVTAIHEYKPDLVFLDISMPGYSGLELLKFFDESQINFKIIDVANSIIVIIVNFYINFIIKICVNCSNFIRFAYIFYIIFIFKIKNIFIKQCFIN